MSWRRWERAAKLYGKTRRPVEKITKWNIVRGDLVSVGTLNRVIPLTTSVLRNGGECGVLVQVQILAGKDKGKQGKVNQVIRVRNSVMVEGLNTVSTCAHSDSLVNWIWSPILS